MKRELFAIIAASIFAMLSSLSVFADEVPQYYMGFAVERMITAFNAGMVFSGVGTDNSDEITWSTPAANTPYTYTYTGAGGYDLSNGLSSSFELGWHPYSSVFIGLELMYMDVELSDEMHKSPMNTTFDIIAAMLSGTFMIPVSNSPSAGLYISGSAGYGSISLTKAEYILDYLSYSSNPVGAISGSYIGTQQYPIGLINRGSSGLFVYTLSGGVSVNKNDVFFNIGVVYFSTSKITTLKDLRVDPLPAVVWLTNINSGIPTIVDATVSMDNFLKIGDFSVSNLGLELAVRVAFGS